jgi:hypothetical protein
MIKLQQKSDLKKKCKFCKKCMEDMKAVYRLNEEKLGFNHKVLKEKEKVSLTTIKGLKKRE